MPVVALRLFQEVSKSSAGMTVESIKAFLASLPEKDLGMVGISVSLVPSSWTIEV